jgi:hypothetical protein
MNRDNMNLCPAIAPGAARVQNEIVAAEMKEGTTR